MKAGLQLVLKNHKESQTTDGILLISFVTNAITFLDTLTQLRTVIRIEAAKLKRVTTNGNKDLSIEANRAAVMEAMADFIKGYRLLTSNAENVAILKKLGEKMEDALKTALSAGRLSPAAFKVSIYSDSLQHLSRRLEYAFQDILQPVMKVIATKEEDLHEPIKQRAFRDATLHLTFYTLKNMAESLGV